MSEKTDRLRLRDLARAALRERGLIDEIPDRILEEADALHGPAAIDGGGIDDLRELPWCSIDNADSLDLDQLSVAEKGENGSIRVRVAVADVDALVPAKSILDRHAQANTTSVYVPGTVFPMLPVRLSEDLTSLDPETDRVAVVTEMSVGPDGGIHDARVRRGAVHNHVKLAYPDVAAWLDGRGAIRGGRKGGEGGDIDEAVAESIRLQDEAASRLRALRHEQGALDLETIQARSIFDGDELVDMVNDPQDRARLLIEDLMIAVNGVTARHLDAHGFPTFRRVVREPDRWGRIREVAARHGGKLPREPDSKALDEFLLEAKRADALRFPDLSLTIVKLIGSGEYVVEAPGRGSLGHFGLAVTDYVHSTAPNRRYPDLIAQRLVKATLDGAESPYGMSELESLAEHCTVQEDEASRVERQVAKSAAALLFDDRVGDRFDALVTGTTKAGTWVRVLSPPVEGMLVEGGGGLEVGDTLTVRLKGTDWRRGWIDFERSP